MIVLLPPPPPCSQLIHPLSCSTTISILPLNPCYPLHLSPSSHHHNPPVSCFTPPTTPAADHSHGDTWPHQRCQDLSYVYSPSFPPTCLIPSVLTLIWPCTSESSSIDTLLTRLSPPSAIDDPHKVVKVIASDGKTGETREISYTNCKVVGNGSFGVVFQAKLLAGQGEDEDIAIKKVLQDKRFKVSCGSIAFISSRPPLPPPPIIASV